MNKETIAFLEAFLLYLKNQKNLSENTCIAYKKDISDFFIFIPKSVQEIKLSQIRLYIKKMYDSNFSANSIKRKIAALRSFYAYLRSFEKLPIKFQDPTKGLFLPKTPKKTPCFIPLQQVEEVDFKNFAVFFLYATGLRASELLQLKIEDIDLERATIRVLGKGKKMRLVPIFGNLLEKLKIYLSQRIKIIAPTQHLFLTPKSKPLYHKALYLWVKKELAATGMKKKSPHILRHSFATHLLHNGAQISSIQSLLGHSSLEATQIYTQVALGKIKEIYEKTHPKGEG